MGSMADVCFLCTKDYKCVSVDDRIVTQIKYVLPEITIINLGVPLHICPVCDGALYAFSKFKQFSMESSYRLETNLKTAQARKTNETSNFVDDSEKLETKHRKVEQILIKKEMKKQFCINVKNKEQIQNNPVDIDCQTEHNLENEKARETNKTSNFVDDNEKLDTKSRKIEQILIKKELKKQFCNNNKNKEEHIQNNETEHNLENEIIIPETNDKKKENNTKTKKPKHKCFICNEKFTFPHALKRHMSSHTQEKKFQCYVCNELFGEKYNLVRHMERAHTQEELPCSVCNKLFAHRSNLNEHMKIHYNVKDHECFFCNRTFKMKKHFVVHMKKKHDIG